MSDFIFDWDSQPAEKIAALTARAAADAPSLSPTRKGVTYPTSSYPGGKEGNGKEKTLRQLAAELRLEEAARWEKSIPDMLVTKNLPPLPAALDYVIDNFEASQLAILSAPGGTGKGWLELQLGIAISAEAVRKKDGKQDGMWCPFGIWRKHKPYGEKVLFITIEDSTTVVENRLIAIRHHFEGLGLIDKFNDALTRFDILAMGGGRIPKMVIREGNQQDLPSPGPLLRIIKDLIIKNGYRFVIIDPMAKLHSLEENNNNDMTEFLSLIEEHVLKGTECGLLIAHHENKGGTNRDMETDTAGGRGASAIVNSVRSAQTLQSMTVKEAQKRGLLKASKEDAGEEDDELDHTERLQWVQYRKAGKVNNSPRSGKDYMWLRRNEFGVLLPGTPPGTPPARQKGGVKRASTKPKQSFGGGLDDAAAAF